MSFEDEQPTSAALEANVLARYALDGWGEAARFHQQAMSGHEIAIDVPPRKIYVSEDLHFLDARTPAVVKAYLEKLYWEAPR